MCFPLVVSNTNMNHLNLNGFVCNLRQENLENSHGYLLDFLGVMHYRRSYKQRKIYYVSIYV